MVIAEQFTQGSLIEFLADDRTSTSLFTPAGN